MRVILRKDVDKLGTAGESVKVSDGYARNFLMPRGLAYEATADNERRIVREKKEGEAAAAARIAEAKDLAARLAGASVTVQVKADGDTVYGSVGAAEIVAAIANEHGIKVDPAACRLEQPIKKIGTHDVPFRFGEGAEAAVKLWVLPEEGAAPAE
jgi:large subunit ribosomal protein L9